jgi:peroxiredoxin
MRDNYSKYLERKATIAVIARHTAEEVRTYWERNKIPYTGIPDPDARVANLFSQQWKLIKLGLMPALFVIDRHGKIAYSYYSNSMGDIPPEEEILKVLDGLQ